MGAPLINLKLLFMPLTLLCVLLLVLPSPASCQDISDSIDAFGWLPQNQQSKTDQLLGDVDRYCASHAREVLLHDLRAKWIQHLQDLRTKTLELQEKQWQEVVARMDQFLRKGANA